MKRVIRKEDTMIEGDQRICKKKGKEKKDCSTKNHNYIQV